MKKQKNIGSHGCSSHAAPVTTADITANRIHANTAQLKALLAEIKETVSARAEAAKAGQPLPEFSEVIQLFWKHGNSQRCADAMVSLLATSKSTTQATDGQSVTQPILKGAKNCHEQRYSRRPIFFLASRHGDAIRCMRVLFCAEIRDRASEGIPRQPQTVRNDYTR
jgi:hypothetical protein